MSNFFKREELTIAQGGDDPCGCKLHSAFGKAFVFRMKDSCRHNGGSIVFRHFLIAFVQNGIITGILYNTGFQVVRYEQPRNTAKVLIGMHMAQEPVR